MIIKGGENMPKETFVKSAGWRKIEKRQKFVWENCERMFVRGNNAISYMDKRVIKKILS